MFKLSALTKTKNHGGKEMKKSVLLMAAIMMLTICLSAVADAGDKPAFDLKWYGYLKLDGSYDQNVTSHGNFAMWVNPQTYNKDDEQFNMTANETRMGFKLDNTDARDIKLHGQLEFDLYASVGGGTVAENKGMLQLRHAYFSVQKNNTTLLAGQTWDLISPLNPSTLNYPVLWGCGNIGYRRPQVTLMQAFEVGNNTNAVVAGGFFRTIGTDLTPTLGWTLADSNETSDGADDGTDAGIPSFQGRLDITHKLASGATVRFGASGHWGQLKAETNHGNYNTYESWVAAGHLMVSFKSGMGVSGEVWQGSNIGSYFGGILNNSTVDGAEAFGGWGSLWFKPAPKVQLSAGFGMDDPEDEQLASDSRAKNQCYYSNVRYSIASSATVGIEVSQWETEYKDADTIKNLRLQTSFILNF
jgi:hypothetical protein